VRGDWDDLDAAVEVAASKVEMSVLSSTDPSSNPRVFRLVTVTDEPGRLTVRRSPPTRPPGASPPAPELFQVEASVGRFGDPQREQALIDAFRRRLEALAGVDFAPLK
jgi:hypothetical protein